MAVSSFSIAKELQEALGLPPEITRLEIHLGIDAAVEVFCAFYPTAENMAQVTEILKRYTLVEQEGPPVSDAHAEARERDAQARGRTERLAGFRERLQANRGRWEESD